LSRYEKGVLLLILSLSLTLFTAVISVGAEPQETGQISSGASSVSEGDPSSQVPVSSQETSSDPEPVSSEPAESEEPTVSEVSGEPESSKAPQSQDVSSRASSNASTVAKSSSRTSSGSYYAGGGNVSKKPEPSLAVQSSAPTAPGAGGTVNPREKNISRLDREALKWLFIPILGIALALYILISENRRAVLLKKGAAGKSASGAKKAPRREKDGSWSI